jgi:ABC-type Na+ efflux pump permease subunit
LSVEGEDTSVPYFSFTYTVLVPILLFLPAFISGSITSDIITEGFKRGTIELLRAAPLTDVHVIDGKLLAMCSLAPIQAAAWLLLVSANGVAVQNIPALLVLVTGVTLVVGAIGALVAMRYRDRSKSQFIYSAAIVGLFSLATLLPEHPVNTVARLSIGSATGMTYTLTALYLFVGVLAVWLLRTYVSRVGLHNRT